MRKLVTSAFRAAVAVTFGATFLAPASASGGWQEPVHLSQADEGVSCVSESFCVAVDPYGQSFVYDGTSWSGPTAMMPKVYGFGLSCVSDTFCMALKTKTGAPKWAIYDANIWSTPKRLPGAGQLLALSCVSTTMCMAGDADGMVYIYGLDGWSKGTHVVDAVHGISCVSESFCMAIGEREAASYDGASWSDPQPIAHALYLESVSCPTAQTCVAVDGYGRYTTYENGTWSPATRLVRRSWQPNSVSCPTVDFCVMVDRDGHAAMGSVGGSWTHQTIDRGAGIASVSCPSETFCTSVNAKGDAVRYETGRT